MDIPSIARSVSSAGRAAEEQIGLFGPFRASSAARDLFDEYYGSRGVGRVVEEFRQGERSVPTLAVGALKQGVADPLEDVAGIPFRVAGAAGGMLYDTLPESITDPAEQKAFEMGQQLAQQAEESGFTDWMRENKYSIRNAGELASVLAAYFPARDITQMFTGPLGDAAMRGFLTTQGDVIIPNFYGPRTDKFGPRTESLLQRVAPDEGWDPTKSFDENWKFLAQNPSLQSETQNTLRQGLGALQWGARAGSRVLQSLMSPRSRALYRESGLSPVAIESIDRMENSLEQLRRLEARPPAADATKEVKDAYQAQLKALKTAYKRQVEIAHSQLQQMANIRVQANARATREDVPYEFALAASDPNAPTVYFRPSDVPDGNWYHTNAAPGATRMSVSPEESQFVQDHITSVWKDLDMDRARIIVKQPMSDVTGAHFLDVVDKGGFAGPVKGQIGDIFINPKGPNPDFTVDSLEETLRKRAGRKDAEFTVQGADDTGVYIQVARQTKKGGRGKVEGGINLLIKVEPNGNLTGYMSDLHDFLEKAPVIGPALDKALPTQVLAVSPPMQSNIYSVLTRERVDRAMFPGAKDIFSTPRPSRRDNMTQSEEIQQATERLQRARRFNPSMAERVRQMAPASGYGMFYGGAIAGNEEE